MPILETDRERAMLWLAAWAREQADGDGGEEWLVIPSDPGRGPMSEGSSDHPYAVRRADASKAEAELAARAETTGVLIIKPKGA